MPTIETTLSDETRTVIKSNTDIDIEPVEDNQNNNNNNSQDNPLLNLIYGNIKQNLDGVDMDLSTVMLYTARTMEFVETFNKKTNNELDKKELVTSTIHKFLDDTTELEEFELDFIKFMLDGIIESIIKTSSKEINIGLDTKRYKISKKNKLTIGQIIDELHTRCSIVIKQNKYDTNNILINIPVMVGMVMSLIEQFNYLNGTEKKAIIVRVIKRLLIDTIPKDIQLKEKDQHKINILITILPDLVDILIEIANHKYLINTTENCFTQLLKKLSCKRKE